MERASISAAEFAARRALIGLTAEQLGEQLGVNPRTIRGYESGKYTPGEGVIADLDKLIAEHTAEVDRLDGAGVIIELPDGPKPRGWYLALGARLVDRDRDVMLEWHRG